MNLKSKLNKIILLYKDENRWEAYNACKDRIIAAEKDGEITSQDYDTYIQYLQGLLKL